MRFVDIFVPLCKQGQCFTQAHGCMCAYAVRAPYCRRSKEERMMNGTYISRRNCIKLFGASGVISILGLSGLNLAGCASTKSNSSQTGAFKLGSTGPITGAAAIYGASTKQGALVAIDEINKVAGSIKFDLNYQDDENDAEKTVNAYNNLKDWGMQIFVGATTTTSSIAVSSEANSDNMFMLTPSSSGTDVIGGQPDADGNVSVQRKKNVFQMCFTDPNQGSASAQYIADKKLATKIAVLYNNSDVYSTGVYKKFMAKAKELGLTVVVETSFTDDSATDFSVQLNKAKDAGADFLFMPMYYQPASLVLTQAKTMGYAPQFFGVDGLDGLLTLEGFDTSLAEGVMLLTLFTADATDEKTKTFVKTYKEQYGSVPTQFAADAYDAVYVVKKAIEKSGVTPDMDAKTICDKLIGAITASDFSYDGLTGTGMTWSDTGEVSKKPKGMVIKNGAYVGM